MSYLVLADGIPDFRQAVISFWFRVPQSSIDAAAGYEGGFVNVVPLITWGRPQIKRIWNADIQDVAVWHIPDPGTVFEIGTPSYSSGGEEPAPPSYIGVECFTGGTATLTFNIQMADYGTMRAYNYTRSRVDYFPATAHGTPSPGDGWTEAGGATGADVLTTITDFTATTELAQPEYFMVQTQVEITPARWHHLLLSFDLRGPVGAHGPPQTLDPGGTSHANTAEGTDGYARLWYAIDDVNYRGGATGDDESAWLPIGPYAVDGGGDPNAILTPNAWHVANSRTSLPFNTAPDAATYAYAPGLVPSGHGPFGIPATTAHVDKIQPVEMAELQFFTGVSFDTGDTIKRRAFISDEGGPVMPEKAEELLSQKPEILLHGSGNWIMGHNTGPPKIEDPDNPTGPPILDPAKQFTPTGKIVAFTPGPKVGA